MISETQWRFVMENPDNGSMAVAVFAVVCTIMAWIGIAALIIRWWVGGC